MHQDAKTYSILKSNMMLLTSSLGCTAGNADGCGRFEVAGSRCTPLLTTWRSLSFLSSKLGQDSSMHQIKVSHVVCLYGRGDSTADELGTDMPVEFEK